MIMQSSRWRGTHRHPVQIPPPDPRSDDVDALNAQRPREASTHFIRGSCASERPVPGCSWCPVIAVVALSRMIKRAPRARVIHHLHQTVIRCA